MFQLLSQPRFLRLLALLLLLLAGTAVAQAQQPKIAIAAGGNCNCNRVDATGRYSDFGFQPEFRFKAGPLNQNKIGVDLF